jgi:isopenicillin-N N-acyltransferase-like protein
MQSPRTYPLVVAAGSARDRGVAYGSQARELIGRSMANYRMLFRAFADIDWLTVRRYALRYEPIIETFDPDLTAEMRGMAEGAGVDFEDILAMNVRTEVMYGLGEIHAAECTAFAALPNATANGHTLIGQNWDWNASAFDSCVVLVVNRSDRPSLITVVEAGLLGKMGMNSAGVGLATNAMASDLDQGAPGIPYHVLLRAALGCTSVAEARTLICSAKRASSANFLIASSEGEAIDIEVAPGGPEHVFSIEPSDGVLGHANCFIAEGITVRDETAVKRPLGRTRQRSMDSYLAANHGRLSVEGLMVNMADHTNAPNSLCRHPLEYMDPADRSATVASAVMDLTDMRFWVADGQPCTNPYREIDLSAVWQ